MSIITNIQPNLPTTLFHVRPIQAAASVKGSGKEYMLGLPGTSVNF
jgi:hypothetical protein